MKIHENILISFGFIIGVVGGIVFCVIISAHENLPLEHILLKDGRLQWETLIGSILAIVAAGVTVRAMIWQVHEQRRRKRMAAFSALPLTLLELSEYNDRHFDFLGNLISCSDNGIMNYRRAQHVVDGTQQLNMPSDAVEILRDCVEFADEEEAIALASLVGTLQVRNARIRQILNYSDSYRRRSALSVHNIRSYIINSSEVDARLMKLLQVSRGDTHELRRVCVDDITSSLRLKLPDIYESDPHISRMAQEWKPMLKSENYRFFNH